MIPIACTECSSPLTLVSGDEGVGTFVICAHCRWEHMVSMEDIGSLTDDQALVLNRHQVNDVLIADGFEGQNESVAHSEATAS